MHLIVINGEERAIPEARHEITLGQRINYAYQYGNDLDEQLRGIRAMKEGEDKELAFTAWQIEKMFCEFAFFAGVPLDTLKNSGFTADVASIYFSTLAGLIENE